MNLYKLTVYSNEGRIGNYYVIAKDESTASRFLMRKYEEWKYSFSYVYNIELIAVEGQFGKPIPLLICK